MNVLLDTHAFLWFIAGDDSLSESAKQAIESTDNTRFLSIASLWEISIKVALGRLEVPLPISTLVEEHVKGNHIEVLDIKANHLDKLLDLPQHHRDPFDRLMIAQAQVEQLCILSVDRHFSKYDIELLW